MILKPHQVRRKREAVKVWIIERDHQPMSEVRFFRTGKKGTAAMKRLLNDFRTDQEHHYYDAVLYERLKGGRR
jgi:hypothetical protein